MAGLSAAWFLGQEGFDVSVFEKGIQPGFSVHSRDFAELLPNVEGQLIGDVPSRMFNEALWPSLISLYRQADIEFEPVDHLQTFSIDQEVLLKVGLPYKLSTLLLKALKPKSRRLLTSIDKFRDVGNKALETGAAEKLTFGDFIESLSTQQLSPDLLGGFLLPALTSTVFTCPPEDLLRYPCDMVLEALQKITDGNNLLMRTVHGSRSAAEKLIANVDSAHFDSSVSKVSMDAESATVFVDDKAHRFDHVVVATQANHASLLVSESLPTESKLLERFRYVDVPVVVHTDSNVLPTDKSDWSTFNFDATGSAATCTVWMNRFHPQWPKTIDLFHSIFPAKPIDQSKVLSSAIMQRPVVGFETSRLHEELGQLHDRDRRVWFAGSWAAAGVPLLESAVESSRTVVAKLTARLANVVT